MDDDEVDAGTVRIRFSLPEDLAATWRELERLHASTDSPEPFVRFLVLAMLASWRGTAPTPAYADVYLRDRWRCSSPVRDSRHVTPHHIVFRAHGGGEERGNLVSLCEKCHLELVHGGRLRVTGLAPDALSWEAR